MFDRKDTLFIIVDVQTKLFSLMDEKEKLSENFQKLVSGMLALGIPILWMEQNPDGLGPTIPEVKGLLGALEPMRKKSFSCCASTEFMEKLEALERKNVVIAGIETHICVYQTASDLLERGYAAAVVADAVSSRTEKNMAIGLQRISAIGASISSVEMILFELLRTAEDGAFKEILKLVK